MFKKFLSVFLVMVIVLNASAFAKPHWHQVGDKWRYLHERDEDDYFFSEWKKIEGAKYYFDDEGFMVTGYQEIDGEYYLFGEDGKYIKDITEYEYMNHMANLTAETGYNPLGEKYLEIHDDYKDYIESVHASKEYESESKAEAEEERLWLLEKEREKKEEQAEMTRELPTYVEVVDSKKKEVLEKIKQIKSQYLKDGMSDFEKEMIIVQYIVTNVTYDLESLLEKHNKGDFSNRDCYSAYGALIKGKSVCAGYADAFLMMAKEFGLEAQYVSSGTHAWNKVKIDDKWYNVDTTWEDPVPSDVEGKISAGATYESLMPHNDYKFGHLNNNWINLTDDEIRKKDTSGIHHNEKKDANNFKECTSSDYGKKEVDYYLLSGLVEKNISNDKFINYVIDRFKYIDNVKIGALKQYYWYDEEIEGLEHIGGKFQDNSNYFNLDTDREKVKEYIIKFYNNKKEMVPIVFTKAPTERLVLCNIAKEIGLKKYYSIEARDMDYSKGTTTYFLCMKYEGDLESLKSQNNETTTTHQTTTPQTTAANTIAPAETIKSNSSSKINYEEASGKKTKNKKSLDDEDVEEYEEDIDEDEIDSDDE